MRHVHGDQAGRCEVRIEAGKQFEIETAIDDEIEGNGHRRVARSRERVRSVPFPNKVELLDVDGPIGEGEVEWDPDCEL